MYELNLIKNITNILGSKYIGDDCAYLRDLGIVITQDSLVEDVHFVKTICTPYQIGYKSIMVNLSDIAAAGAEPKYLTVALSLPSNTTENEVSEFYEGAKAALQTCNAEIVGGDITASDKICISVCAIGTTKDRKISSRKCALPGYKIITSGLHGSSAAGLKILLENLKPDKELIKAHLMPTAQIEFSKNIAKHAKTDYAMMDTSDGLFDALYKIGEASNCTMSVEFEKIIYNPKIKEYFKNYKDLILFGGEDYQLVAAVPVELLPILKDYIVIGDVLPYEECFVKINYSDIIERYNNMPDKCYNHFE